MLHFKDYSGKSFNKPTCSRPCAAETGILILKPKCSQKAKGLNHWKPRCRELAVHSMIMPSLTFYSLHHLVSTDALITVTVGLK